MGRQRLKEMIELFFRSLVGREKYHSTKSLNNLFGLPFTIFDLKRRARRSRFLKSARSLFGEGAQLAEIASPDYGIITNIGQAHIEFLKNREGVLTEKSALLDYISKITTGNFETPTDQIWENGQDNSKPFFSQKK